MRILVLGAYGFIGSAVARQFRAVGHDVTGLGRSVEKGARLVPEIEWVAGDISRLIRAEDWRGYLDGIDVVVNASGALQHGLRDRLTAVQETAIIALIEACETAGIERFVQISAPGVAENAATEFMRTKARADNRLKQSALAWVILRPGLVIGPAAYGGTALIRMLAALPLARVLVLGDSQIQTVAMADVADVVMRAAEGSVPARSDLDLVEPGTHTLRDVVDKFRAWLGITPARVRIDLPRFVGYPVAKIADLLGYLGWRSPLRSTALKVLADDILGDPEPLREIMGRHLSTLDRTLAAMPATVQERWYARLSLAMPLMVVTLSAFWLASGIIPLMDLKRAFAAVPNGGAAPFWAHLAVFGGIAVDLILGAAILIRPFARKACYGMAAVTALYLVAGSILTPDLWTDPLGPLVKTIPAMVLALVTPIVLEDR